MDVHRPEIMRYTIYLFLLFWLSTFTAFGQFRDTITFKGFLSHFEKAKLPLCENYDDYEQQSDSAPITLSMTLPEDTEIAEEDDTIVGYEVNEHAGVVPKDSADIIPAVYYSCFLQKAIDSAFEANHKNAGLDYLAFPLSMIKSDSFTAITVEFQYVSFSRESIKYLVAFDRSGQVLDLLEIASYEYGGSYTDDYGRRGSWFPIKTGCIDRKWELTIEDDAGQSDGKYKITSGGKIVALKTEE